MLAGVGGPLAVASLQALAAEIGVLISDQRMPGEKGVELLEKALSYANLFDPFFVRTNKPDDFGVNMMACYSIVYLHGGTIEAKSGSLSGVEITMDFPFESAPVPNVSDFFQSLVEHERRWKERELEVQSA